MDDAETFDALMEQSSTNAEYGDFRICKQKLRTTENNRIRYLLRSDEGYSLKYADWKAEFQPRELEEIKIRDLIPSIAEQLVDLQQSYEQHKAWDTRDEFFDALWDLEVVLGRELFS